MLFLNNSIWLQALTVTKLYKKHWNIEFFFKWIKGKLRIKHYYRTSLNAVNTQISIAVTTYVLVAIPYKELKLPESLHGSLQILSVKPFEKIALHEMLMKSEFRKPDAVIFTKRSCMTYNRTAVSLVMFYFKKYFTNRSAFSFAGDMCGLLLHLSEKTIIL